MLSSASAIRVIVVVCVAFFLMTFMVPDLQEFMFETFALYYPAQENFGIWQFVTNIFMHGGFAHIFFNMYALWAFGSPLEQIWGKNKCLLFFFLSGIGAAVIYTIINYFQFNAIYNDLLSAGVSMDQINTLLQTSRDHVIGLPAVPDEKIADFYNIFHIPVVGASGAIYGVL